MKHRDICRVQQYLRRLGQESVIRRGIYAHGGGSDIQMVAAYQSAYSFDNGPEKRVNTGFLVDSVRQPLSSGHRR